MFFKDGHELFAHLLGCLGALALDRPVFLQKHWWEISFDIRYLYAFICLIDLPSIRARI
jgi:hypothetical protein